MTRRTWLISSAVLLVSLVGVGIYSAIPPKPGVTRAEPTDSWQPLGVGWSVIAFSSRTPPEAISLSPVCLKKARTIQARLFLATYELSLLRVKQIHAREGLKDFHDEEVVVEMVHVRVIMPLHLQTPLAGCNLGTIFSLCSKVVSDLLRLDDDLWGIHISQLE